MESSQNLSDQIYKMESEENVDEIMLEKVLKEMEEQNKMELVGDKTKKVKKDQLKQPKVKKESKKKSENGEKIDETITDSGLVQNENVKEESKKTKKKQSTELKMVNKQTQTENVDNSDEDEEIKSKNLCRFIYLVGDSIEIKKQKNGGKSGISLCIHDDSDICFKVKNFG